MTHTCHAYGCETQCADHLLMCKPHWDKVPSRLKQEIYALRGKLGVDPAAARKWRAKAQEAINAVGARENNFPPPIRRDGMRYVCDMPEGYHSFAIVGDTVFAAGANMPTLFFNPKTRQWEVPPLPAAPPEYEQERAVHASKPKKD